MKASFGYRESDVKIKKKKGADDHLYADWFSANSFQQRKQIFSIASLVNEYKIAFCVQFSLATTQLIRSKRNDGCRSKV